MAHAGLDGELDGPRGVGWRTGWHARVLISGRHTFPLTTVLEPEVHLQKRRTEVKAQDQDHRTRTTDQVADQGPDLLQ